VAPSRARTDVFAWYTLAGSLATAFGALAAGYLTAALQRTWDPVDSYRVVVLSYAAVGALLAVMFACVSPAIEAPPATRDRSDQSMYTVKASGFRSSY